MGPKDIKWCLLATPYAAYDYTVHEKKQVGEVFLEQLLNEMNFSFQMKTFLIC